MDKELIKFRDTTVTFKGETHTWGKWSKKTKIPLTNLFLRITVFKWGIEKSLTTPKPFNKKGYH